MSVLDSILDSMQGPPVIPNKEKQRMKKIQDALIKKENKQKEKLKLFRRDVQKKIDEFVKREDQKKLEFPILEKIYRSMVHEVSEDAGLVAYSFGQEGVDRYIVVYKKEFVPTEDELNALRRGEEWTEEKARKIEEEKRKEKEEDELNRVKGKEFTPVNDYKEKYQHLIGKETAKDAARKTEMNKQYGFVPSANKKDSRSIEQTLADIQQRKKLKCSGAALNM